MAAAAPGGDDASPPLGDRFRITLDSLLEGFQIIAFDWTYLYVNPAAASQGRATPADLIGKTMPQAYPGIEATPLFEQLRRCMTERTACSFENLFEFPNGDQRWFELRIEPVPEGVCIHSVDVHERKQAEAALRQLNDRLEAQVAERTAELKASNKELEAFTYSVSHDLRAPLRHIMGFVGLLERNLGDELDDSARDHLQRINKAAGRMGELVDDLLSFSRTSRLPLTKRRVALNEIVAAARAEVAAQAAGRNVIWNIHDLHDVDADPALLRTVFVELLSNALKFTRDRATTRVDVMSTLNEAAREVVVCVADNGAGFDLQYAGKLFGVFQRLHHAEEFDGTGIGLATVRRIIQRHGGWTTAEGEIGHGAKICFSLPLA